MSADPLDDDAVVVEHRSEWFELTDAMTIALRKAADLLGLETNDDDDAQPNTPTA